MIDNSNNYVENLIGNAPGWLLKSGITMVSLVFITIIFISSIIKYPDTLDSIGEIKSHVPICEIITPKSGKIYKINYSNSSLVESNTNIAEIYDSSKDTLYILKAEKAGKLLYLPSTTNGSFVSENDVIGHIIPEISGTKYISCYFSPVNFSKVKIGQKCLLSFDEFPIEEYGKMEGRLSYLSKIPTKKRMSGTTSYLYEAEIEISKDLSFEYENMFDNFCCMQAKIEVLLNEKSVLKRLMQPFYALIKQNVK